MFLLLITWKNPQLAIEQLKSQISLFLLQISQVQPNQDKVGTDFLISSCVQAYYNFKSQLTNVAAKVGTGPRSDFTKPTSIAPAPTAYLIKSRFEKNSRG